MTPADLTSGARAETADQPPRNLNDPVCCKASALTQTLRPAISSTNEEFSSGVRRTLPSNRCAAARIISIFIFYTPLFQESQLDLAIDGAESMAGDPPAHRLG